MKRKMVLIVMVSYLLLLAIILAINVIIDRFELKYYLNLIIPVVSILVLLGMGIYVIYRVVKIYYLTFTTTTSYISYTIPFFGERTTVVQYKRIRGFDIYQNFIDKYLNVYTISFYVLGEKYTFFCLNDKEKDDLVQTFQTYIKLT